MTFHTILFLILTTASLAAFAGGSALDAELDAIRTYCKDDVDRLCPNVEPGGGRIKACLKANKEKMSVGCAQALMKLKQSKQ